MKALQIIDYTSISHSPIDNIILTFTLEQIKLFSFRFFFFEKLKQKVQYNIDRHLQSSIEMTLFSMEMTKKV